MDLYFPPEWLKAALVLALVSTWVLVGLYAYLNRYTQRRYFGLWTSGWLFYALWITFKISFLKKSNPGNWEGIEFICIGTCAVLLFWGALLFSGRRRGQREMGMLIALMVAWSFAAREYLKGSLWLPLPFFLILSLASFLTAGCFLQKRLNQRYIGASLLGLGFGLWGIEMALQPFFGFLSPFGPTLFVLISITQLVIAIGMIVLMLEEGRGKASMLQDQIKADTRLMRRLQKEISIAESKYKHLFEHGSDSIFIIHPRNLRILDANHACQALTGYTHEELLQLCLFDLFPFLKEKEREISADPLQIQSIFSSYGNMSLQRKDHHMVLTEGSASVMDYSSQRTLQIFLREVTGRRRLEQQLRQAEKLSALGQLISGVAHELNNPLAIINGYAQLLVSRSALEEKVRTDLLKIQHESERASKIVQNFLAFARKHPTEKTNVNLNKLIKVTLELVDYDLRVSGITLTQELQPDLPDVFADPNQLEQVFLNIIINAVHSMEGSPHEKALKIRTESTSSSVKVMIFDRGTGIPPSILEKIFDPFFTTKGTNGGTGLGLSISFNIIKEHSGTIYAQNHEGGGAIFIVELPISPIQQASPSAEAPLKDSGIFLPKHTFHVLVVDDEVAIQEVFSELLLDFSCHVLGAGNGIEAIELIEQKEFDLVICDLKMPGMDGQRLFEEVKRIRPSHVSRFIFTTGDTNSPKTMEFLEATGNRWIAKPFNFRDVERLFSAHFKKIHKEKGGSRPSP